MRLTTDELTHTLSSANVGLPSSVLINSNEPLLVEETLDTLRAFFNQHGFSERIKYQLETGFDWSQISTSGQSMSLFAEHRIIELRVPKSLGTQGTKAITEYSAAPSLDDILIIIMPLLDKRQRGSKWFQALASISWVIDGYSVNPSQFPQWLKQRIQQKALRVEPGVIELLSSQLEGNLLAAAQEIDKLTVLANDGALTLQLVQSSLADQAKFDVYALADMCLLGKAQKAIRIKHRLQSEGVEPVIVVWSLAKEIRTLATIATAISQGQSMGLAFKQHRVWSQRETLFHAALNRINHAQSLSLLEQVAYLDQTVKGQRNLEAGHIWHQIESLCHQLCGLSPLAPIIDQARMSNTFQAA